MALTRTRARGVTLTETLVAVLVMSAGALGLAGLQAESLSAGREAYERSLAVQRALDMMDRIRANRAAPAGEFAVGTGPPAFQDCLRAPCGPREMARFDVAIWKWRARRLARCGSLHAVAGIRCDAGCRCDAGTAGRRRRGRGRCRDGSGHRPGAVARCGSRFADRNCDGEQGVSTISSDPGRPGKRAQRACGASLIELMLALGLGVIVASGAARLFADSQRAYMLLHGQTRMQESARQSLDFIARSVRSAGYMGCRSGSGQVRNTLNGAWGRIFEVDLSRPVEAFDGTDARGLPDSWTPSLSRVPRRGAGNAFARGRGVDTGAILPFTDVLVLRRVAWPGARVADVAAPDDFPVVQDDGELELDAGDLAVISDCRQAALFRIDRIERGDSIATLVRTPGDSLFDNAAGVSLSATDTPYGSAFGPEGAAVFGVVTEIYFIARGSGRNNVGSVPASLWRKTTTDGPVELIQGIEDLQVRLGLDSNRDGAVDRYALAGDAAGQDVRSIDVRITANSVDAVGWRRADAAYALACDRAAELIHILLN